MNLIDSTDDFVEFLRSSIPEKQSEFDSVISKLNVSFILDTSTNGKVFRAIPTKNQIVVGQKGIERLWAHAFAYAAAFLAVGSRVKSGTSEFEPISDANLLNASQILTWAINADIALKVDNGITVEPAPSDLPSPFADSKHDPSLSLAQALWCQALCFIMFHELEHLHLRHSAANGIASVEQEKEADREAARWLLEDTEGSEQRELERGLGLATSLVYLAVTDVYLPRYSGDDYPPGYDRLFQTLSQYFYNNDDESEQVWCFTAICLTLHILNKKLQIDSSKLNGSWQQFANSLIDEIAKQIAT